jgi:hypothetical protein
MYLLAKNRGIVSKLLYLIKDTNPQAGYKELFSAYIPNFQKSHFTLSRKKAFEGVQTPSPPIKSIRSNY